MKNNPKIVSQDIKLGDQTLTLEVGRYAQQATAAVAARLGDTVVHATVVVGRENPEFSYLPLFVEYQEKLYAGGKIKGSRWVKREGRPSDESILTARLIDRSIRPLFPQSLRREIQIIVTTLSVDSKNDPDIPAIAAVSAALSLTDLPFNGPVAAIRLGFVPENSEGNILVNPTYQDRQYSDLDLVESGNQDRIVMVEADANQINEDTVIQAMKHGHEQITQLISGISKLVEKVGPPPQQPVAAADPAVTKLAHRIQKDFSPEIAKLILSSATKTNAGLDRPSLEKIITEKYGLEENPVWISAALDLTISSQIRKKILKSQTRPDGRKPTEIRPIENHVSELPRTHGSAMFQRGSTQVLTITTLAPPSMEQLIESPESEETKRYIHHYYSPPYSYGETGRMGWPSRREVGHGALAERALLPVIPAEKDFPYTIRVVSEIMSSNGSTSMASVCGSTLSLMDAGVPIKAAVAGIAMGVVIENDHYVILSDIIGLEDFHGDMDFKIAGTKKGVTALQMDVKVPGISFDILKDALDKAKTGRLHILDQMLAVQPKPNPQISPYAPQINMIKIDPEKIGSIIGPGGKTIKRIIAETGTEIDVEDDGTVTVSGMEPATIEKAVNWIKGLTQKVEPNQEYEGTVVRLTDFGAFVNILPGKDGLVHVSKLAQGYINHPSEVTSEGEKMKVRVESIDEHDRVSLIPVNPFAAKGTLPPRGNHRHRPARKRVPDRDKFRKRTPSGSSRSRPPSGKGNTVRRPYYERGR